MCDHCHRHVLLQKKTTCSSPKKQQHPAWETRHSPNNPQWFPNLQSEYQGWPKYFLPLHTQTIFKGLGRSCCELHALESKWNKMGHWIVSVKEKNSSAKGPACLFLGTTKKKPFSLLLSWTLVLKDSRETSPFPGVSSTPEPGSVPPPDQQPSYTMSWETAAGSQANSCHDPSHIYLCSLLKIPWSLSTHVPYRREEHHAPASTL